MEYLTLVRHLELKCGFFFVGNCICLIIDSIDFGNVVSCESSRLQLRCFKYFWFDKFIIQYDLLDNIHYPIWFVFNLKAMGWSVVLCRHPISTTTTFWHFYLTIMIMIMSNMSSKQGSHLDLELSCIILTCYIGRAWIMLLIPNTRKTHHTVHISSFSWFNSLWKKFIS